MEGGGRGLPPNHIIRLSFSQIWTNEIYKRSVRPALSHVNEAWTVRRTERRRSISVNIHIMH
jgi:hypothetical protein